MKIVIAADSFKGCMSSLEAATQIEKGILRANPAHEVVKAAMADGGEGTAQTLAFHKGAFQVSCVVLDAYGQDIAASYYYEPESRTAIMDAATVIGLNMYPKKARNPMLANCMGLGMLMKDAIALGARRLIIGLGGSATNDGGMGILAAFGAVFYDSARRTLPINPYSLDRIAFIDKRKFHFPKEVEIIAAADVKNHLLGLQGATYVFGRQKGLFENQLAQVDQGMAHYRDKVIQTFHVDLDAIPGSGAAGGIGSVLLGVLKAQMVPGIQLAMEYANMEEKIAGCDMVITGEGQTDRQTCYGKLPMGIAQMAKKYGKPCICLSGALAGGYEDLYEQGMDALFSATAHLGSFEHTIAHGPENLEKLAYSIFRLLNAAERIYR